MKQRAVVYGIGKDYFKYESEIKEKYEVVCLADGDTSRKGSLHGIPFVQKSDLIALEYDVVVVVPAYHKMEIISDLRKLGIKDSDIVPYIPFQSNMVSKISLELKDDLCYGTCGSVKFMLRHSSDFGVMNQIFAHTEYGLKVSTPISVIDVGMNIGLTTLYFAAMENVKHVYSYEPFPETYRQAIENINMNDQGIREKITAIQAGLGSKNVRLKIKDYSQDFSWGMRVDNLEAALDSDDKDIIMLLNAGDEISKVISECSGEVIVLKLDCEGSEYDILSVLEQGASLTKIGIVLMETHDFKENKAIDLLSRNGFTVFHQFMGTAEGLGMVYATRQFGD